MTEFYTIASIVGFSLAAVFAVVAVVMYFRLHIKQVRDDLTGRTVERSIAEIRSRAKAYKHTKSAVVRRLGWQGEAAAVEVELGTTVFDVVDDERVTTVFGVRKDEAGTTVLDGSDESVATMLSAPSESSTTILDIADDEFAITALDDFRGFGETTADEPNEASTTILVSSSDTGVPEVDTALSAPEEAEVGECRAATHPKKKSTSGSAAFLLALFIVMLLPASGWGVSGLGATADLFESPLAKPSAPAAALSVLLAYENTPDDHDSGYYQKRTAKVAVQDPHLGELKTAIATGSLPDRALLTLHHNADVSKNIEFLVSDLTQEQDGTWTASKTITEEGSYHLRAPSVPEFIDMAGNRAKWDEDADLASFTIDHSKPEISASRVISSVRTMGEWLLVCNGSGLEFTVSDALAGIDPATISIEVDGVPVGAAQLSFIPSSRNFTSGTIRWAFPSVDARINLDEVCLSFADRAGNICTQDGFDADLSPQPGIEDILVDAADPAVSLTFDDGHAHSGPYYASPLTVTVTVVEGSFDLVKDVDPARLVAIMHQQGRPDRALTSQDFENPSGDGITWEASFVCTEDGMYSISASFTDIANRRSAPCESGYFYIDSQAPEATLATITSEANVRWGWLFAPAGAAVAFELSDNLSGVDPNALMLTANGIDYPLAYVEHTDGRSGTATWEVPATDEMFALDQMSLRFADRAGTAAEITDVDAFRPRNLEEVHGIVVDSAAPVITVDWDNTEVHNQKYYNASRTATITISEATFGFVRESDPDRAVAALHTSGHDRTITAREFENLAGDGKTWVAQVSCEADGTYQLDVDFTDLSGKQAVPYHGEEFVIDTTAPIISLTFDNNDSVGVYFKASRTAVITIGEENFSPALAGVVVTATDASGSPVTPPGASAWIEAPQGTWRSLVVFNKELHYTLTVTCTDLAGNVAESVQEPEFIIDMTAPSVVIERVTNHAAYRNEVAPLVRFEDANFEPYLSSVSITGAARGTNVYFPAADQIGATTRTLDYEDFAYLLKNDDVYTLTAIVRDKAGNTAQAQVTFSVNRYGSNYELAHENRDIVGSYEKKGHDLTVTETNVSGLASSEVALALNDSVRTLEKDVDYSVVVDNTGVWSRYIYTFPEELFEKDGYYRVLLTSMDLAGGLSENIMQGKNVDRTAAFALEFAVDGSAPLGSLDAEASYFGPSQSIDVLAGDNMEAEEAFLYVNGELANTWDAAELEAGRAFNFDLPASLDPQTLRLEVVDKAGNLTVTEAHDI